MLSDVLDIESFESLLFSCCYCVSRALVSKIARPWFDTSYLRVVSIGQLCEIIALAPSISLQLPKLCTSGEATVGQWLRAVPSASQVWAEVPDNDRNRPSFSSNPESTMGRDVSPCMPLFLVQGY
jgi:hypothetical protein